MDSIDLRRPYSRTISVRVRSLETLQASLDDAKEQWSSLIKSYVQNAQNFPSMQGLCKKVDPISSQIRCIQQEVVTHMVGTSCVMSRPQSRHVDSLHVGLDKTTNAKDKAFFSKIAAHQERTAEPDSIPTCHCVGYTTLGVCRRACAAATAMSIITADLEWLTSNISGAEDYFVRHTINTAEEPATNEFYFAHFLMVPVNSISTDALRVLPSDEALAVLLVVWYYCFTHEESKTTALLPRLERLFPNVAIHLIHVAQCISAGDVCGALGMSLSPCLTEFLRCLARHFLNCMAVVVLRPHFWSLQYGAVFRPVVAPEPVGLCDIDFCRPTPDLFQFQDGLQAHFLRQRGGGWPFPPPLVQALGLP